MPLVKTDSKRKSKEHKKVIFNGVHEALVELIKILDYDRFQIIYEHGEDNFNIHQKKTD